MLLDHLRLTNCSKKESKLGDPMDMFLMELKEWLLSIASRAASADTENYSPEFESGSNNIREEPRKHGNLTDLHQEILRRIAYISGVIRQKKVFLSKTVSARTNATPL